MYLFIDSSLAFSYMVHELRAKIGHMPRNMSRGPIKAECD